MESISFLGVNIVHHLKLAHGCLQFIRRIKSNSIIIAHEITSLQLENKYYRPSPLISENRPDLSRFSCVYLQKGNFV